MSLTKRDTYLLRAFGILSATYDQLLRVQNGGCGICGTTVPGSGRKYFSVDHDHETGRIRGLLCGHCNLGIGLLGDTAEKVGRAVRYLRRVQLVQPATRE